jgi:hypothetical protein
MGEGEEGGGRKKGEEGAEGAQGQEMRDKGRREREGRHEGDVHPKGRA